MGKFYVTTPIYYVNDEPHLGHLYTTVAADALARYRRLAGDDVFFLTGTDEHGQKVQRAAEAQGISPQELADRVVKRYEELWPKFSISNDDFIRTSSARHKRAVVAMWQRLDEAGAIYKGMYEDWYCVPCETFWTETQIKESPKPGCCPDCLRPVERVQEESYFFRLSAFQDDLLAFYREHPDFVQPAVRMNEVVAFVERGLTDLSISRTTFSWGVPVPGDPKHVVYVWIDALTNYLSALGWPDEDAPRMRFWPADVHIIGKDILRFHAVYWPAMLMAAGLPLPRRIFAHGWWTVEGEKMSKSRGNALSPAALLADWDADVLRYFLLREAPFGEDADFSQRALEARYTNELANDIGNLLQRTLSMLMRYQNGELQEGAAPEAEERALIAEAEQTLAEVDAAMERLAFHRALGAIHRLAQAGNRYVERREPWRLAKESERARLAMVLFHLAECCRLIAVLLAPFMPVKAAAMLAQIYGHGVDVGTLRLSEHGAWGVLAPGHRIGRPSPVFPKRRAA